MRDLGQLLSALDAEADLADFEEMLGALERLEAGCMSLGEQVPRVHYMWQVVFECLVPWREETLPAHFQRRVEALVEALLASQALHMCEEDVRGFCVWRTAEQRRHSEAFLGMVRRYRAEFA